MVCAPAGTSIASPLWSSDRKLEEALANSTARGLLAAAAVSPDRAVGGVGVRALV
jgi:hypothetical protein